MAASAEASPEVPAISPSAIARAAEVQAPKRPVGRPSTKAPPVQLPLVTETNIEDARQYLEQVLAGKLKPTAAQLDVAKTLLPYQHRKKEEPGKKGAAAEAAAAAGGSPGASPTRSRFSPAPPPRASR